MNDITLCGQLEKPFEFDHEIAGMRFFKAIMLVPRKNGNIDNITIIAPERLIDISGQNVFIAGQIRSYNLDGKVFVYVLASVINDELLAIYNDAEFDAVICTKPKIRQLAAGFKKAEFIAAINRSYGKASYVPCVAWKDNVDAVSDLLVGDMIHVTGRLHSRDYRKDLKTFTTHEISVVDICRTNVL